MKGALLGIIAIAVTALALAQTKGEIKCAVNQSHMANIEKATKDKLFADHEGRRYYFCCAGCPPKFKKEPAKYTKNDSRPSPINTMIKCAVMPAMMVNVKEATKTKMYADHKGKRYFFCCAACPGMFKKSPDQYAKTAESLPVAK